MAPPRSRRADTPRQRVSITAAMTWDGGHQLCVMENRSPKGARLRVTRDLSQPNRFTLEMTPGEFVPVSVVWRTRDHVGVRVDDPASALDGLRQLQRLLRSFAEKAFGLPRRSILPSSKVRPPSFDA